MKSEYIDRDVWRAILPCMTRQNALAIAVSLETGIRIGDVLRLQVSDLSDNAIAFVSSKTGKAGIAQCPEKLLALLRANARHGACFPPRAGSKTPHRTRQAVWKNVRAAAERSGIKPHISPHSARKTYAVELYHSKGIAAVQRALQHDNVNTTNLYALADLQGAAYDRDRLVRDVADVVMRRLAATLGVADLEPPAPDISIYSGEDDLR